MLVSKTAVIMAQDVDYFSDLKQDLTYMPVSQIEEIRQAYLYAARAHDGQKRRSGEPYITHPVAVARILADLQLDAESLMAALLHDVIEDTHVEKQMLAAEFGDEVAELVDGLSKLTLIEFGSQAEAQAENFRKMVMAMVKDIRIILVKLADRLHNMRTLDVLPYAKRERIARETLDIYAPIANRLGIHSFHIELEELCFRSLFPFRYQVLNKAVHQARGDHEQILLDVKRKIEAKLALAGIQQFKVWGREKHLYGIYKKMRNKRLSFSEIMDVFAFRLIVDSIDSCYRALGIVHNIYKPVPERFKDYIAIPKVNGYQSLHTTLFGPYGIPIEIQVRTREMDQMADSGIASHWRYKIDDDQESDAHKRARSWIKGLLEMQSRASNSLEFIENVKIDLFAREVFVFTPKGKILELPAGATPVDFAYTIHSDIGNSCVAAKIDRRLSPLSTILTSGQTVEIISAPGARPNPAWLNFVVTGKARGNIKHYIKQQRRDESVGLGKFLLDQALEDLALSLDQIPPDNLNLVLEKTGFKHIEDLFESIGLGDHIAMIIARRLAGVDPSSPNQEPVREFPNSLMHSLAIKGSHGMMVNFSHCCYPIPGDPIIGFLQTGQGLVVHHELCRKASSQLQNKKSRIIPVRWEDAVEGDFDAQLRVEVVNRRGVLAQLAGAAAEAEANIEDIGIEERDGRYSLIVMSIAVRDRVHLARVIRRVRRISSVVKLTRYKA